MLRFASPILLAATCFCPLFSPAARSAEVVLAAPNQPVTICLIANAQEPVHNAAAELKQHLQTMTGQAPVVVQLREEQAPPADKPAILLGATARPLAMAKQSRARDGFRYKTMGNKLGIVGESAQGVFNGAVAFLEHLGCGWYVPGPLGEVIPHRPHLKVGADLDHSEVSDSIHRRFWYGGKRTGGTTDPWRRRNRAHLIRGSWRHAWSHVVPKSLFDEHPDYFSLIKGKRRTKQLCTTNPETVKVAAKTLLKDMAGSDHLVYPAGPNDGGGLCECAQCAKLHTPGYLEPSSGKPCYSDVVFGFARDVSATTAKQFPDKDLGVLVYSEYSRGPKKMTSVGQNVFPLIAPIRRCRFHGPGHPNCEWNKLWLEDIKEWRQVSEKLGFYCYNYNLADTLVPLAKTSFYRRLVQVVQELDIKELAWVMESIDSWSTHAPHLYLSSRIMWNSRVDIDQEMDRFYNGFYGAAAVPMKRYWTRIDDAYEQSPTHTGSQYGLRQIWTDTLLTACRADISAAAKAASTPREKEAVALADAGLKAAEHFVRIWSGLAKADFAAAAKADAELETFIKGLPTEPISWAHERYAYGYYKRFLGLTVAGGAELINNGGRVVAQMPDRWRFMAEHNGAKLPDNWAKPDCDDANWPTMATMSRSWDDQGLGRYHGQAVYRTTFTLPATENKEALYLWFGGFDHNIDVYINGHSLGVKKGFAKPVSIPLAEVPLHHDRANSLVVRVDAGGLAEMGTGGLMMPVVLYSAVRAAKDAKKAGGVAYEM